MTITVSLDAEPFAAAMKALEPMSSQRRGLVAERLLALADARRHEVVDFRSGEKEIVWCSRGDGGEDPDEWLAIGHGTAGQLNVTLLDPCGEPFAEWEGEDARALLALGRPTGCPRQAVSAEPARREELEAEARQ